ncbi:NAD(P)-dependent oxidoreductase [Paracoccus albus]|uniref:NAD(P)-dependent oxidoreductase n=1 Tax=Paracoccus albus TaxID=3017784 RepID=UPI0022F08A68|nr:NAD(P)-dependent oxidoreductase [Paracoccus albus]WBU59903.1 NAD(P)-dependent oxidoreductase [Paracoccus albus]
MEKERVGIIGVGLMGHGIAQNIVAKGWPLSYLIHPGNQPTDRLDEAGARPCETTAQLASQCDILLLCVTGTPQVEDVLTGSGDLLSALRKGMVVIDCSTAIPESTVAMAEKVTKSGAHFVDAAMTRTPKEAQEGRLNLLIGGDAKVVERITPLLSAFSENRFYAGAVGSGHRLKLLHNFVSLGSVSLIAEAAACARASGISDEVLVDCLRRGGGYGAGLDRMAPFLLDGQVDQLRFSVSNSLKDLSYYNAMAEEVGTPHLIAAAVRQIMDNLVNAGHGQEMLPRQVDLMAQSKE